MNEQRLVVSHWYRLLMDIHVITLKYPAYRCCWQMIGSVRHVHTIYRLSLMLNQG
jgi:hypothetical protein